MGREVVLQTLRYFGGNRNANTEQAKFEFSAFLLGPRADVNDTMNKEANTNLHILTPATRAMPFVQENDSDMEVQWTSSSYYSYHDDFWVDDAGWLIFVFVFFVIVVAFAVVRRRQRLVYLNRHRHVHHRGHVHRGPMPYRPVGVTVVTAAPASNTYQAPSTAPANAYVAPPSTAGSYTPQPVVSSTGGVQPAYGGSQTLPSAPPAYGT